MKEYERLEAMMIFLRLSLLLILSEVEAFVMPHSVGMNKVRFSPRVDAPSLAAVPATNSLPVRRVGDNVSVAGKIFPMISKFFIGPQKFKDITEQVGKAVDLGDVVLLATVGWAVLPICTFLFDRKHQSDDPVPDFKTTRLYRILLLLSQFAKIAGLVYIVDVLAIALNVIGIEFPYQHQVTVKCAQVLYTLWVAWRLVPYKKHLIEKRVKAKSPDNASVKIKIYDTLANIIIAIPTVFIILDELKIPVGRALQSVFGLGGVATLVFSYSCKDIAGEIINGLALASSNIYEEGDYIILQDGSYGVVSNMGWTSTDIRGTLCYCSYVCLSFCVAFISRFTIHTLSQELMKLISRCPIHCLPLNGLEIFLDWKNLE